MVRFLGGKAKIIILLISILFKAKVLEKIVLAFLGLVVGYLILYPWVPEISYQLNQVDQTLSISSSFNHNKGKDLIDETKLEYSGNRIIIPKIKVNMPILEGNSEEVLDLGIWRRPKSGTPNDGNMVLTGHRVGYAFLAEDIRNSTSFYHLNKLVREDSVLIFWNGVKYKYNVTDKFVVDYWDTSIENKGKLEKLTLYTCHPLGTNKKRLVVIAKPVN